MSVLEVIYEWSRDRPAWQRDALRRLVLNGDLSADDIDELTEICKSSHGLAEQQGFSPLSREHVPERSLGSEPVSIHTIEHHNGVNALAKDQTLNFGPRLTAVYGDNAAGKTGYIRILKSACRSRGQERILGNVLSGAVSLSPVDVSIKYGVGSKSEPCEWNGNGGDDFLSRVSIFDAKCAAVYLTDKTDVAFRPFGLDLFDKLVQACKVVRTKLDEEKLSLASSALDVLKTQIPEGTTVARCLAGITSLTKPESIKALAHLSREEEARLVLLEKSLLDLQANDPEKLIKLLTIRHRRVLALASHLKEVETVLSAQNIAAVFEARTKTRLKSEEAKKFRDEF